VNRVAREAAQFAEHVLRMSIRASDYLRWGRSPRLSLPLDPVVDPSAGRCTRLIPRAAELDDGRVGCTFFGKVDKQSPPIAPPACANDVLNPFVVHRAEMPGGETDGSRAIPDLSSVSGP
jgi:hypothetical protein